MLDKVNSQLNVLTCSWKVVFVVEERGSHAFWMPELLEAV